MKTSLTIRLISTFLVLTCTAGCDQATKHFARTQLSHSGSSAHQSRFIEFTLAENPGAFLSLGASLPETTRSIVTVGVSVGLAFLLAYLVRTPRLQLHSFLGLALIFSGGTSNLIDRFVRHGLVTDFMVVRIGPLHTGIFNLADFAIVVGMLLLVASTRPRPHKIEHQEFP